MADFGWAFVKGGLLTGSAPPSGSVQFNNGANGLGGSTDLIFESGSTSELRLTGSMNIEGDLSASVNISASAFYGDGSNLTGLTTSPAGSDNQIQFNDSGDFGASGNLTFDGTSLSVTGDITASVNISASAFFGDGSSLTGISRTYSAKTDRESRNLQTPSAREPSVGRLSPACIEPPTAPSSHAMSAKRRITSPWANNGASSFR